MCQGGRLPMAADTANKSTTAVNVKNPKVGGKGDTHILFKAFKIIKHASGNSVLQVPMVLSYTFYYGIWPSLRGAIAFVPFVILWVGYGMSICLHRFFSHQAFKTSPWFATVLGIFGTITNQGGILWWASMHNRHHKYCDQPKDPHSVTQFSYLYAWLWWTLYEYETAWEFVPRVHKNNEALVFLNAMQPIIIWAWIVFLFKTLGPTWTIWGYWIPSLVSSLGSLDFNLQFHPRDHAAKTHRYDEDGKIVTSKSKNCKATDEATRGDDPWIPKIIGEASHLDHHIHPRKSKRPGVDIPHKFMIAPLAYFSLIWDQQ